MDDLVRKELLRKISVQTDKNIQENLLNQQINKLAKVALMK